MNRQVYLTFFLALSCAPLFAAKPNIVLIMADDLGYECIEANGGTSYRTPTLNKLAAEGMRFEHCHSQPICTPSRVKLMTGIANVRNYVEFGLLDPKQTTFAQLLKAQGYATCVVGKWQLKGGFEGPGKFGFDEYALWQLTRRPSRYPNGGLEINGEEKDFGDGAYLPDVVSNYACEFIEKNKEKPFLLYYPMILTHCPFEPTPDSEDWDPENPGSKTYKGDAKYFGDMVSYMDKVIGKILRQLDQAGVRDNTLVIFLGDNGTDVPVVSKWNGTDVVGAKGKMHDWGNRVPFIANWPGTIPAGRVSQQMVDFSDFLPTLLELGGADVPDGIDGKSLVKTLKGSDEKHRDWIYMWYSRNGGNKAAREFTRNQRYKLYGDGKFYDIGKDVMEKSALSELSVEQKGVHKMLQAGLDQYKDARPAHLGLEKKAKQPKKKKRKPEK
ncbi:MAG: arylsulfatase A [Verrucomicrobiales bacterium]|jgi:arylsulfatase A